jgi:hypothetical protein
MIDGVVIGVRQSPDWAALARDWRAGVAIDPARYQPARAIPEFPGDIAALIARWNALSGVDFFTCRARLKEIAQATLRRVARAMVVSCGELPRATAVLQGPSLLFFCDDDDWFAPAMADMLSAQDFHGVDVAVFPFVRFGWQTATFVHPASPPLAFVGPRRAFAQRYHTNNYGLLPHLWHPSHLLAMQDHFDASAHGDRMGLVDRQFGVIIGATNKTPCAASFLRATVTDAAGFGAAVDRYVGELRSHAIPDPLGWMREPLAATIGLFQAVLAGLPVA